MKTTIIATTSFWAGILLHWGVAMVYVPPPPLSCLIDTNKGGVYSIVTGTSTAPYDMKFSEQARVGGLLQITFMKK